MNITVANAGSSVTPGVHLYCYGPYAAPADARSLLRFQPVVNMRLVHHLILYAGAGTPPGQASLSRPSPACYAGSIIYAWARTGQKTPLGLDLSGPDSPVAGAGFAVGPGTQVSWFAVQLHYQNMESASVHDTSGVQLAFSRQQPVAPLRLDVLMSTSVSATLACHPAAALRDTRGAFASSSPFPLDAHTGGSPSAARARPAPPRAHRFGSRRGSSKTSA